MGLLDGKVAVIPGAGSGMAKAYLRGVLLGMKHGIGAMLESGTGGGAIVDWSSVGGLNASPFGTSVYSAAKAGVISRT